MYWQRIFYTLLDELFPRFCVGCQKEGETACSDCLRALPQQPHWQELDGLRVWSAYAYNSCDIDRYIQAWKYRGAQDFLTPWLSLIDWPNVEADLIIAVPLHKKRLLERGFNQADVIAAHLSKTKGIAISSAVRRIRATKAQAKCSGEERRTNLHDAILADVEAVQGKRVLLVDDVVTTGSTLQACVQALKQAGATEIACICLARGGLDPNVA